MLRRWAQEGLDRASAGRRDEPSSGLSVRWLQPETVTNQTNGTGAETVLTEDGVIRIEVPRDRDGSVEPLLIRKHDRRFTGFDDKIGAMYARGMTVRGIQGRRQEQYGTQVSPEFISSVTDGVMAEVRPGKLARSSRCIQWCSSMHCA